MLVILVLIFAAAIEAQPQKNNYRIRIHLLEGSRLKGTLIELTDSTIHLGSRHGRSDTIVSYRHVQRIAVRRMNSAARGFGIGFGSGAVLGGLIGLMSYSPPDCDGGFYCIDFGPGASALAGGVVGAIGGGVVGLAGGTGYRKFDIDGDNGKYMYFCHSFEKKH